jgi:phosphoribosylanthranilate isomerase
MTGSRSALRIKICGQTTLADANASVAAGADMIGVIFCSRSKRFVPFEQAAQWIGQVPERAERVAVFVDPTIDQVRAALRPGLFHTAQLHGDEPPEFLQQLVDLGFGGRVIKAIRVNDASSLDDIESLPTRRFLLDGPEPGSGRPFDWSLAAAAVERHQAAEFLLAGGLTPGNVPSAIQTVRPHGVDVVSGVESAPGTKSADLVMRFIEAARRA